MYYKSEGKTACGDVIPFYDNGTFYLFYLKDYRGEGGRGEGVPWNLVTTKDLVHYEEHGEVIPSGGASAQDLNVFTGSCAKFNGEYYIFYTGDNLHFKDKGLPQEVVLLAKSKDLLHWEKVKDFSFPAPEGMERHNFRDPYVFYDEEKGKYAMLVAARENGATSPYYRGITLVAYSDDLLHWEAAKEPFIAPTAFYMHECPDLFKMGDWWYLVFSEFSDKFRTVYRMSRSLGGPWITPKSNDLDGRGLYAAKTACDGKHRYLFGWNSTKKNETDAGSLQWGGNIAVHELIQAPDGTLSVICPAAIADQYKTERPLSPAFRFGKVETVENGFKIGSNGERSTLLLGQMPENCRIEATFESTDEGGDFGFLFRADQNAEHYYAVKFEPKHNRFALSKWPHKEWDVMTKYIETDSERYCPIVPGTKNRVTVIVEGSVGEIYVNGVSAAGFRMYDYKDGAFGIYAQFTEVTFTDLRVYEQ